METQLVVVVDLVPLPGCREELVALCVRNSQRVVALHAGCRSYVVDDRGPDGPVVVLTRWDGEEEFSRHLEGQTAATNLESFVGLLAAPIVPRLVRPRPTGRPDPFSRADGDAGRAGRGRGRDPR